MVDISRLREFVLAFTALVDEAGDDEVKMLADGKILLGELVSHDDWLPDAFAQPDPERYQQYLLYCDPAERFSVVSFVWGAGQTTPIHDHTVWGMVGVMRGAELCEEYGVADGSAALHATGSHRMEPGAVDLVSPTIGDVHRVSNALADRPSVSIHVYGANIGAVRRHVYDAGSGEASEFISGYSNDVVPNLWNRVA